MTDIEARLDSIETLLKHLIDINESSRKASPDEPYVLFSWVAASLALVLVFIYAFVTLLRKLEDKNAVQLSDKQ
ncbi:hypothetical protein CJU89_4349 [Yarrowia sp. B02]|nr:hypothetical protein CJU89_4349 [Yarrowia sp. B02]